MQSSELWAFGGRGKDDGNVKPLDSDGYTPRVLVYIILLLLFINYINNMETQNYSKEYSTDKNKKIIKLL